MKKNLAKQITLGIVIGTMLMGSGTVYADGIGLGGGSVSEGVDAVAVGTSITKADDSIVIGSGTASSSIEIGGKNSVAIGADTAIGISNNVTDGAGGVALGAKTRVHGTNSVALGYGSYVGNENNVVSVGSGTSYNVGGTETRRIINVSDGINDNDAATVGQMERYVDDALANVSGGSVDMSDYYTKTEADERYVKITTNEGGFSVQPTIVIDDAGQMVFGSNSSWIDGDGEGFYAGRIDTNEGHTADNAKAAMTSDGQVIAQEFILKNGTTQINVKDELDNKANKATTLAGYGIADAYTKDDVDTKLDTKADADNVYTKTETDGKLDAKADKATTLEGYGITDAYTKNDIDGMIGGSSTAVNNLSDRLDRTEGRIDKVGAGAAALAALHPLDYDSENKLSFAAGVGNYAGSTAAAVGAFYRPNENVMFSIGGTAGNGENMVNLGASFAIGKGSSGMAKLSKAELVQAVNDVKAENSELRYEINNAKAENQKLQERIAKLEEMVLKLAGK